MGKRQRKTGMVGMKIVVGLLIILLGFVFLDLSTLALKKDLYLLTLLGTFNNLFSLSVGLALFQAAISLALVVLGVKIIKCS
jgi:hypothetical protein